MVSPLGAALSLSQPMVSPAKAQIAPTDVLGAYQMSTNQANQQYLAKLQQQNALWGGLAGLGGSALTAGILKGGGLFSPAAHAAATAAGGAGAAAPAATAAAAPFASGVPGLGNFAGVPFSGLAPPTAGAAGAGLMSSIPAAGDVAAWTAPSVDLSGAGYLTGAGGDALASAAPTVAADTAGTAALGTATADAGGMTLADILPFLFPV